MSKVEKALQKARALENGQTATPTPTPAPEPQLSNVTASELMPVAGELRPYVPELSRMVEPWRMGEADLADARIIYPEMPAHRVVDAFREIRTRILQACPSGNCIVLVTSVGGGASFVALNLAAALT